jgi:hypothetical protein
MTEARRPGFPAYQKKHIGSVDPDALKIPARRAECSLTENARSPFHAEPEQTASPEINPTYPGQYGVTVFIASHGDVLTSLKIDEMRALSSATWGDAVN